MKRFIEGEDRAQVTLLPECLDDFIAEDNSVRVVDARNWTSKNSASMLFNPRAPVGLPTTRQCCSRSTSTGT